MEMNLKQRLDQRRSAHQSDAATREESMRQRAVAWTRAVDPLLLLIADVATQARTAINAGEDKLLVEDESRRMLREMLAQFGPSLHAATGQASDDLREMASGADVAVPHAGDRRPRHPSPEERVGARAKWLEDKLPGKLLDLAFVSVPSQLTVWAYDGFTDSPFSMADKDKALDFSWDDLAKSTLTSTSPDKHKVHAFFASLATTVAHHRLLEMSLAARQARPDASTRPAAAPAC